MIRFATRARINSANVFMDLLVGQKPLTRFIIERDLPEELQRAESAGCDLVLIDSPPGRSSEAPAAVEASDLVLIPFWNDVVFPH